MLKRLQILRMLIFAAILAVSLGGCAGRGESPTAAPPIATAAPAPVTPQARPTATTTVPTAAPTVVPTAAATSAPTSTAAAATALPTAGPTAAPTAVPAAPPTVAPAVAAALPVRLQIPALKLDVAVVEMGWQVIQTQTGLRSEWDIPKNEAGHHLNSARLGEAGNLVISGHNNIHGQVFKPVSLAWQNDRRVKVDDYTDQSDVLNGMILKLFDAAGVERDYSVTAFYRLRETGAPPEQQASHARYMQSTDREQVTIITCWPPTSNTHRLILIAEPAR